MVNVSLEGVRKSFGAVEVLHGIDLEIRSGEFVVFVGPSGCGKSTMLRAIAGLEEISAGVLKIGDVVVNKVPPANRGIAMVFQSYALYPHMTVFENMAFGLRISRLPKETIRQKVNAAAALLQLTPYLDRLPRHLSGGQRQRVAIGRAITRDPKVFLFDEPLSNLDAALRVATRIEIANLKETLPDTTMIYVTHDQVEAMTLADRIVVFNAGQIEQIGTPLELYHAPSNLFVAQFIGSPAMNILPASTSAGAAPLSAGKVDGRSKVVRAPEGGHLGIRPEHIVLGDPDHAAIKGTIVLTEELGEFTIAHIDIGSVTYLIAKFDETAKLRKGDKVGLDFPPERMHVFGADGRAIATGPVSAVA